MIYRAAENVVEPSIHGTLKRVILRGGILPDVTQVAVAELHETDVMEPHSHPTMYEVYYVLAGTARYYVGDECHHATSGDLVIVPPGVVHRQQVIEGPHRIFYWGIKTD